MSKKTGEKTELKKLRIKLRAYDHKIIDNSAKQIIETAFRCGNKAIGPIPLPTETHKYTVNRATFVHKTAMEQFEIRIHKRLIDILNTNADMLDSLMNLTLPAGIDIEIKT